MPPFEKGNQLAAGNPTSGAPGYTEKEIEALAKELYEWADREDSIILSEFALSKRKSPEWSNKIADSYPVFSQAYDYARGKIGARRQKAAYEGKCNSSIVEKSWGMYDKEYRSWVLEQKRANAPVVLAPAENPYAKQIDAIDGQSKDLVNG
jgi:hypothetical protein